jgi:hypothetical protein
MGAARGTDSIDMIGIPSAIYHPFVETRRELLTNGEPARSVATLPAFPDPENHPHRHSRQIRQIVKARYGRLPIGLAAGLSVSARSVQIRH